MALKAFDLARMQGQADDKVIVSVTLSPLSFVLITNALLFLHEYQWLFVDQSDSVTEAIDAALAEMLVPYE